jgi:BirA family transcriptional regulator, biotin operon repressor / biotin---[acetyl-CoA-carboxylase] ligase
MLPTLMKALAFSTLRILANGEFHSGATLARASGMSRASVWNAVAEIEASGIEVFRVRGRGYRLAQSLSMLDAVAVTRLLGDSAPFSVDIVEDVDSTNTRLLERARSGAPHASVIAAESQRAGRGRMNRPWHVSIGGGLAFSLLWRFTHGASVLAGLSLAVGLAVARALEVEGAAGIGLKWPNDLQCHCRKIAGILIEMQGEAQGPSAVVIGIGVNVRLSPMVRARVDQPATDLETVCGREVDRNVLLAQLLTQLNAVLIEFERAGFQPLRDEWQRRHVHHSRNVLITLSGGAQASGVARGVDDDGALLIETAQGMQRFHSGDVTLRTL